MAVLAPGAALTKRQRIDLLVKQMEQNRDRMTANYWRDIRDLCLPQHGQFSLTERSNPQRNTAKIIDGTATRCLRTFGNGMMMGTSAPNRKWFELGHPDPDLEKYKPVAVWLEQATDSILGVLRRSNFYNVMPGYHVNLAAFGTAAMGQFEDMEDAVRFYPYPIGSFAVANNSRLRVDAFSERCQYTVRQLVEKFGLPNCSDHVKRAWAAGQTEEFIEAVQFIGVNPERDPQALSAKHKPFTSYYYEAGSQASSVLRDSGFDEFPILCTRFTTEGKDAWGLSPTMDLLGDIKALQVMHRQKAMAVETMVRPPLMGPASMKGQALSTKPGMVNYIDVREGMQGLSPVYQLNFPVGEVRQDIAELQKAIKSGLFEDLFLMLANSDRREITAEEVRARLDEKILVLSPLLERLDDDCFDPMIDRTFAICNRFGMLPPAPEELQGQPLRIKYTSVMAQAQRAANLGTTERLINFVGTNAEMQAKTPPDAWDVLDMDEVNRGYAADLGASPRMLRSVEELQAMRDQRAQAQQQQAQMEQAEIASKTVKNLAQSNTTEESALTELAGE